MSSSVIASARSQWKYSKWWEVNVDFWNSTRSCALQAFLVVLQVSPLGGHCKQLTLWAAASMQKQQHQNQNNSSNIKRIKSSSITAKARVPACEGSTMHCKVSHFWERVCQFSNEFHKTQIFVDDQSTIRLKVLWCISYWNRWYVFLSLACTNISIVCMIRWSLLIKIWLILWALSTSTIRWSNSVLVLSASVSRSRNGKMA